MSFTPPFRTYEWSNGFGVVDRKRKFVNSFVPEKEAREIVRLLNAGAQALARRAAKPKKPPEVELHSDWVKLKKPGHYGSGKTWRCTVGCHKSTRLARFARPRQDGRDNGACLLCARRGLPIHEAPKPTTRKH
jgi:hypothetical protein